MSETKDALERGKKPACEKCGSVDLELFGESGVFWPYCRACDWEGPDLERRQKHGPTVLAADFLREPCPECHMVERCKMSCSRGGSKGGRFSVRLDSRKDGGQ